MLFFLAWFLFQNAGAPQTPNHGGTKVVVRHTAANHTSEWVTYVMADRRRIETHLTAQQRNAAGALEFVDEPGNIRILRCDLGKSLILNSNAGEYISEPYPPKPLTPEELEQRAWKEPEGAEAAAIPTVRYEITTADTGESKIFFGRVAWHVITTRKQIYLESPTPPEEYVTDGWYIDFDTRISCEPEQPQEIKSPGYLFVGVGGKGVPIQRMEYVEFGPRVRGFAVEEVETSKSSTNPPAYARNSSGSLRELKVTQFVEDTLDPALFEVPPGFKQIEKLP
jgi:hypothetical protein